MFTLGKNALGFEVKDRVYGIQDKGVSPRGASDQLSFKVAKILLAEPKYFLCFEIIFAKQIIFDKDCVFTLTGAHYKEVYLHSNTKKSALEHSCVYKAQKGDYLSLHHLKIGFRLYLMASLDEKSLKMHGLKREKFSKYFQSSLPYIRLIKGPEYHYLIEPDNFFNITYKIAQDSNLIGLRLQSKDIKASKYDIISSSVNDGTVQLTKDGAIVLLRHRPTTGGYPRIFSVIAADLDTLAQYPLGSSIHFKLSSMSRAKELLLQKEQDLQDFKTSYLNQ